LVYGHAGCVTLPQRKARPQCAGGPFDNHEQGKRKSMGYSKKWNQPANGDGRAQTPAVPKPKAWGLAVPAAVATAVIAASAILAVWYFGGRSGERPSDAPKPTEKPQSRNVRRPQNQKRMETEMRPASSESKGDVETPPPPPKKDWQTLQREAMARKLGRKKEHEIVYNDSNAVDAEGRSPVHRNSTEHIMSMVFGTDLGDMPFPLPSIPERDKQRMAQILLDKFDIQPNDPDAEEKQAINEAKEALSEHIRSGGDIDEFFAAYHRQLEIAHRERVEARNLIIETAKSGDADLAAELMERYNRNLQEKGIKPITLPQWVIEKKARTQ